MMVILLFVNTLTLRKNGCHSPDEIFNWIFLNENVWILIGISSKFVPGCPINNNPTLVQIMAWRRPGDKPLFEPVMVNLLMHICVTRPQGIKMIKKVCLTLGFGDCGDWGDVCVHWDREGLPSAGRHSVVVCDSCTNTSSSFSPSSNVWLRTKSGRVSGNDKSIGKTYENFVLFSYNLFSYKSSLQQNMEIS